MKSPNRVTRKIMKNQFTDEFGGYSKTWFADKIEHIQNMQQHDFNSSDGADSQAFTQNADGGLDSIARSLGINIEQCALELALDDS